MDGSKFFIFKIFHRDFAFEDVNPNPLFPSQLFMPAILSGGGGGGSADYTVG
jgi:hypothetical protein